MNTRLLRCKKVASSVGIIVLLLCISFKSQSQDQVINGDLSLGYDAGAAIGEGHALHFLGVQLNSDWISIFRHNRAFNSTDLRVNIGDDADDSGDRFVVGVTDWRDAIYKPYFMVHGDGRITIGTEVLRDEKLAVNGKIRAHEIKVENSSWPDYVFKRDYNLLDLYKTEAFINRNSRLPGIPSAEEVKKDGVDLGEMNAKLLEKIEELTLHLIKQQKQLDEQGQLLKELVRKN